jgi:hypothetical protein
MKPSQYLSLILTVALAALGVCMAFTGFPPAALPWCALGAALVGGVLGGLVPSWVPVFLPAHVAEVLAQIFRTGTTMLGAIPPVIAAFPTAPPSLGKWVAFAIAMLGAFNMAILPHVPAKSIPAGGAQPSPQAGFARPPVLALVAIAGAALLALALAGCSPSALQMAEKSVTAADQVQAAGAAAFADWDLQHQQDLVDHGKATELPVALTQGNVTAYRAVRTKVVAAFSALADASHAAKAGIDAVSAGKLDVSSLAPLLGKLYAVALDLAAQAKAVGWTVPGLDALLPASVFSQPPPTSRRTPRRLAWAVA